MIAPNGAKTSLIALITVGAPIFPPTSTGGSRSRRQSRFKVVDLDHRDFDRHRDEAVPEKVLDAEFAAQVAIPFVSAMLITASIDGVSALIAEMTTLLCAPTNKSRGRHGNSDTTQRQQPKAVAVLSVDGDIQTVDERKLDSGALHDRAHGLGIGALTWPVDTMLSTAVGLTVGAIMEPVNLVRRCRAPG